MSYWQVVIPYATKNYIPNPSFEIDTTGWEEYTTGTGAGNYARTAVYSRFGIYGGRITKSAGVGRYGAYIAASDPSDFSSGDVLHGSVYVQVPSGLTVGLILYAYGPISGPVSVTLSIAGPADGRYNLSLPLTDDPTAISLTAYTENDGVFYLDAAQIEAAYVTDYCDGDQEGCYWNGRYHGSTSQRVATSRRGGRAVDFDDYGFYVSQIQGIGVPPHTHVIDPLPLQDGALYRRTLINQRTFVLQGSLIGTSRSDLHAKRKALFDLFKLDRVGQPGAQELRYSGSGDSLSIQAIYQDGMSFGMLKGFTEDLALRFVAPDPYWVSDAKSAAALTLKDSFSDANYALLKERGVWQALDTTGTTAGILAAVVAPDGTLYVGGNFASLGGVADTAYIAAWYAGAWHPLATGLSTTVYALVMGPDGTLYVGGVFLNAGGDADADYVCQYDPATDTFSAVGGSPAAGAGAVWALAIGPDGTLYAGGDFTSLGGVAANYCAQFDGSAWSAMGSGMDGKVRALVVTPDVTVYAAGEFSTADGNAAAYIAEWSGSAWADIGGTNNIVYTLDVGPDGLVYLGGKFTTAGSVTVNYVAVYTGSTFSPLGTGTNGYIYRLHWAGELMYAGGVFSQAGGIPTLAATAIWNGTTWLNQDFACPGDVYAVVQQQQDVLLVGFLGSPGNAYTSHLNTVTNTGSRSAFPVFSIHRSGGVALPIYWLENLDTGARIYLNYNLLDGEELVIDFRPGQRSVVSSLFGSVWKAVLRGSNVADFCLLPGANRIALFAHDQGTPTVTCTLTWTPTYYAGDSI